MSKVKKLKVMQPDGNFSDPIDIGVEAVNVEMDDGNTIDVSVGMMKDEIQNLQQNALTSEDDPTVPLYVKQITEEDIANWNKIYWNTME